MHSQLLFARPTRAYYLCGVAFISLLLNATSAPAQDANTFLNDVADTPFGALQDIEVTSVSKQPERSFDAAAAIYVLTSDDIKRSGATSVAEALRQVPGIEVARIDANKWAITSRGFNRELSNKLLVLVDGRSVYSPLFSGVYWDEQDIILEDIERIEVIRGPGASLWGANAVNGVINITTKAAQYTQGNYGAITFGNFDRNITEARHGGKLSDNLFYRISGRSAYTDGTELENGLDARDDMEQKRADLRLDWTRDTKNTFTLIAGIQQGEHERQNVMPGITSPIFGDEEKFGSHLLARWDHEDADQNAKLQLYFDYSRRDTEFIFEQEYTTIDLDWQHGMDITSRLNLLWGLGYRHFVDDLSSNDINGITYLSYDPQSSHNNLYSGFVQGKYALIPNTLNLTLGSKFEHNYYTDFEYQPTARLSWSPASNQTVWAAVSRAIRTPSRGERDISLVSAAIPPGLFLVGQGNDSFQSERLIAYELGYRIEPYRWLMLDFTAFYNDYDELRAFTTNFTGTQLDAVTVNGRNADIVGIETASRISFSPKSTLFANFSIMDVDNFNDTAVNDTITADEKGNSPQHQINLLWRNNVHEDVDFDINAFYVSELENFSVDNYLRFDMRFAWRPLENIEFSLVGQNILDDAHQEFGDPLFASASEVPRSAYIRTAFSF